MNIFHKVTLKTLKINKTRTIVTIIGIILSLSMFTAVTTSVSSFQNYMLKVAIHNTGNWHGSITINEEQKDSLTQDSSIESVAFLEHLGYSPVEDCVNPDKPYLFLWGMDTEAFTTLSIQITEGRMPQNGSELLIPNHLAYNGDVSHTLNETLTLEIGDRISFDANGNPYKLNQNTPYLYTQEEQAELRAQGSTDFPEDTTEYEEFLPKYKKTYTITGFYDRFSTDVEFYSAPGYTALTVSDAVMESATPKEYTAYIRFHNPETAIPWLEENYPDSFVTNWDLLRMYGASHENAYNGVLYGLAAVLILIILLGSISLIYNAFSISVTERTKQFGLLSSLGATRPQLVKSVLFEALCLCCIGIPIGILAGIGGIGITFAFLGSSISNILYERMNLPLTLYVSPSAILIAGFIGLFTVLISAYLPARRTAKLSPIDAIRLSADIQIRPGKIKSSKLTYRLFGLSGILATKNFKRNKKKYRATVISLCVSIVLFISASSFCSYLVKATEYSLSSLQCDITCMRFDSEGPSNDEVLQKLFSLDTVTDAAWLKCDYSRSYINASDLSSDYLNFISDIPKNNGEEIVTDTNICFVNDSAFAAYLEEINLPKNVFLNPKHPVAIAFDFSRIYQPETGRYLTMNLLDTTSTTIDLLQIDTPDGYSYTGYYTDENNQYIYTFSPDDRSDQGGIEIPEKQFTNKTSVLIGAVPEELPFYMDINYSAELSLLFPASAMATILGEDYQHYLTDSQTDFRLNATDHKKATADISQALMEMGLNNSYVYNYAESVEMERALVTTISVFSYGFIILISLIAMANVFNTISTNIQLRKREFAMLKSVGMSPIGFRIMMCYECLLYGIKGLLYGLPISFFITWLIYRSVSNGLEINFYIPLYSIAIAIASIFLVVGSTIVYSMQKIKKENIMDTLKDECS